MAATEEELTVDAVTELLIQELPWVKAHSEQRPDGNLDVRDIALTLIDAGVIPLKGK
jgi:hypothetical protein